VLSSIPLAMHLAGSESASDTAEEMEEAPSTTPTAENAAPTAEGTASSADGTAPTADSTAAPGSDEALLEAFMSRNPARIIRGNLEMLGDMYGLPRGLGKLRYLGLFLLGLYVGRRRIFEEPSAHRAAMVKMAIWGFSIGIPATLGVMVMRMSFSPAHFETLPGLPILMTVADQISTLPFAFAYIAGATLLLEIPPWRRLLSAFAPVGRTALTNYIAQTVICLVLYIGLGLMADGGWAVGLLLACVIFAGQMALSAWWLRRYRFGPLEWLWRCGTYGRLQPMRVAPRAEASAELAA